MWRKQEKEKPDLWLVVAQVAQLQFCLEAN